MALNIEAKEVVWSKRLFHELQILDTTKPTIFMCDN
jgi:hypothetical protein